MEQTLKAAGFTNVQHHAEYHEVQFNSALGLDGTKDALHKAGVDFDGIEQAPGSNLYAVYLAY